MKPLILILIFIPAIASGFTGECVKVADGDTITVREDLGNQTKVRLYGIDCPEKKQAFGQKAKRFTLKLTINKIVTVAVIDTDRYGRSVGVVNVNGICVNSELLKNGLAWMYNRYCKKPFCSQWQKLEKTAKSSKTGLWSEPSPVPPWDFRKGKKSSTGKVSVTSGNYHGNIKSHKFHRQRCKYFDCNSCTVIFKSRRQAIKQGYSPCKVCKP